MDPSEVKRKILREHFIQSPNYSDVPLDSRMVDFHMVGDGFNLLSALKTGAKIIEKTGKNIEEKKKREEEEKIRKEEQRLAEDKKDIENKKREIERLKIERELEKLKGSSKEQTGSGFDLGSILPPLALALLLA
jgi:hypothetical protein